MATTTNYGWTTPDDTSLVKDGAAAIRTLGSSIDTTTKNLNPSTTLGDIEYRSSSANTNTRLGIGTTGQFLTVSGGVPAWGDVSAGSNWSLLNAGGTALTGSQTVTVSGISGKDKIMVIVQNASSASAASLISVRLNTDTASNYFLAGAELRSTTTTASLISGLSDLFNKIYIGQMSTTGADSSVRGGIVLTGGNSSGVKQYTFFGAGEPSSGVAGARAYYGCGYYNSASTISSISVNSETGNFDAGTVYVYTSA
jgi:hypothetical protein